MSIPDSSDFISNFDAYYNYWPGRILSFIIGISTSLIGNYFYDKYKIKSRGSNPYMTIDAMGDMIRFQGQISNTQTSQKAIVLTLKSTITDNPSSEG